MDKAVLAEYACRDVHVGVEPKLEKMPGQKWRPVGDAHREGEPSRRGMGDADLGQVECSRGVSDGVGNVVGAPSAAVEPAGEASATNTKATAPRRH